MLVALSSEYVTAKYTIRAQNGCAEYSDSMHVYILGQYVMTELNTPQLCKIWLPLRLSANVSYMRRPVTHKNDASHTHGLARETLNIASSF